MHEGGGPLGLGLAVDFAWLSLFGLFEVGSLTLVNEIFDLSLVVGGKELSEFRGRSLAI